MQQAVSDPDQTLSGFEAQGGKILDFVIGVKKSRQASEQLFSLIHVLVLAVFGFCCFCDGLRK